MDPFTLSVLASVGSQVFGSIFGQRAANQNREEEYWYWKKMNEHLTGREQEQNAFNAEQAQINRDFQQEMSDTSYQRTVTDMQKAGVNPALAMNNGPVSTPAGSNATGSAGSASPLGVSDANFIGAMANLMKLPAEIANINADTRNKDKDTEVKDTSIESLRTQIEGSNLDNEQKRIVLQYLNEQEQLKTQGMAIDNEQKAAQTTKLFEEIDKMSYEKLEIFSSYLKNLEEIEVLKSQKSLTDTQAKELLALIGKVNAETAAIGLDIKNYDLTHGATVHLDIGFGPFKAGSTQYLTLSQLREYEEKRAEHYRNKNSGDKKENNAGLDYHDYRID